MAPKIKSKSIPAPKKTTRSVPLGNPSIVQLKLEVDKTTGQVQNLVDLIRDIEDADLDSLGELWLSLFGKPTRTKKRERIADALTSYLKEVEAGYVAEAGGTVPAKLEEKAEAHHAEPIAEVSPGRAPVSAPVEDGQSFTRSYKGASFTLTVHGDSYLVSGPPSHPCSGQTFASATAAAKAMTGYTSINGRAFWGISKTGARTSAGSSTGRGRKSAPSGLTPRDPRLPAVGETITKVYDGKTFEVEAIASGFEVRPLPTGEAHCFDSISKCASFISGGNENGYLFFGLNVPGAVSLDPWAALAVLALADGRTTSELAAAITAGEAEHKEILQGIIDDLAKSHYMVGARETARTMAEEALRKAKALVEARAA